MFSYPVWRTLLHEHYALVLWIWLGLGLLAFLGSLRTDAPYGRHTRGGWGPQLNNRLAWFLMEIPVLICFHAAFWTGPGPKTWPYLAFAGLFSLHYGYRALIYPWRLRTGRKRMPWAVAGMAIVFNIGNGTLLGHGLGHPTAFGASALWPWGASAADALHPMAWPDASWTLGTGVRVAAGLLLFFGGWAVNLVADNHLIGLRRSPRSPGTTPGSTSDETKSSNSSRYRIPRHPLFRYTSCPNHLGEMVEWTGFALLTAHPAAMVFAAWTVLNVLPRSLAHHRWYRMHFADYPPERKALLPFVL
jgi:hypothetical protein